MRSWKGVLLGTGVAAALVASVALPQRAAAQVPFSIVRPQNDATVRETVHVQLPRAAVPPDGYLAVSIDNRFRVALAAPPSPKGENDQLSWDDATITFLWNTKAIDNTPNIPAAQRTVGDGAHTIEVTAIDKTLLGIAERALRDGRELNAVESRLIERVVTVATEERRRCRWWVSGELVSLLDAAQQRGIGPTPQ